MAKKKKNFQKNTPSFEKKIPEKYLPVPLVPAWLLMPLWFVSLALPNLIYSGILFADTLHILKWTVTGVPIAIAVFAAGVRFLKYGRERLSLKLDIFAVIWAVILVYCALQPLWVEIFSPTGYVLEMLCFVTIWAFYVISVSSFPDWGLRFVLILGNLNAAINVLFAELQVRSMNDFAFLQGTSLSWLRRYSTIILPTPENYIGNTAQQNMFGLWVAVATLGAIYLFVFDAWKGDTEEHGRKIWIPAISIALAVVSFKFAVTEGSMIYGALGVLLIVEAFVTAWRLRSNWHVYYAIVMMLFIAVNFWGLMNSTSRSATLALAGGVILLFIMAACKFNRNYVFRLGAVLLVLGVVFWASLYSERSEQVIEKTVEVIQNAETIGRRRGIWTTSASMFLEHPEGVGIGQYKWHYMEAQRYGFDIFPFEWYNWQYTHWAHNEFLQFFCEGGVIGGVILLLMWAVWLASAIRGLIKKPRMTININAVWAVALASLITFCAIFTRPFHRIENMVWITLAFALSNREFIPSRFGFEVIKSKLFRKCVAFACIVSSVAGCIYISSGIYGNYVLREALSTQDADIQYNLLTEASKHPIVYEEAQRNLGYHFLQVGEQTEDYEALANGFNILWAHFNREPHSEDISRLLNFAQRYQIDDVLRELKSYFKPGTYHLIRRPQTDAEGHVVNALLMVDGPGSDDE